MLIFHAIEIVLLCAILGYLLGRFGVPKVPRKRKDRPKKGGVHFDVREGYGAEIPHGVVKVDEDTPPSTAKYPPKSPNEGEVYT